MSKIFVIGHKSPDTDSIVAAISYAKFRNLKENTDIYVPARAGEINKATAFVLQKFGFEVPELLENLSGQEVILVDHNESAQSQDGIAEAKILGIVDHHKLDFKYGEPIEVMIKPWGSSNSLIASLYYQFNLQIEKNLAGIMLSAILDDTVITKSPTCTETDKKFINELAKLAGIQDWQSLGLEIFKAKSAVKEMTAAQILKTDFKDFNMKAGKFGVGQVETVDLSEFADKEESLLSEVAKLQTEGGYHSVILFITDIMKEGSQFLVSTSDTARLEEALGTKFENSKVYIPGILSRKKQVTPMLAKTFDV